MTSQNREEELIKRLKFEISQEMGLPTRSDQLDEKEKKNKK
ncbi:MAG: hypothetical protein ACM3PE_02215 [Deltaproteobacteria bacterium]